VELQALAGLLRRRWPVILLTFVVGIAGGVLATRATPKRYATSARLYVSLPPAANVSDAVQGVKLAEDLLTSYAKMLDYEVTTRIVAREIDNRLTSEEIRESISASVAANTVLIDVKATERNPRDARELADAAATALTRVIASLQTTQSGGISARVVDRAQLPDTPVTPVPRRNVGVGAVFGLIAGFALALAIEGLDRTIKTPAQATAMFGAPVLGSIPKERRLSADPLVANKGPGSPAAEAYRALRTSVRFRDMGSKLSTILVTSPAAGDGKTTVAANLAVAMSQDGARVILIDGDLRRTRVSEVFEIEPGPGLTAVLLGRATLREALTPWSNTLSILQTGPTVVYPSEALGSTAMQAVIKEATELADVVIIDAPPVLPVTDPVVLAALVDGTIMVCRWGRTSFHAAEATRLAMERTQGASNIVGVVLNAEGGGRSSNYYRHYSTRGLHVRNDRRSRLVSEPVVDEPAEVAVADPARSDDVVTG
jgi:capsular exopolysaccharide synthesis family protein